MLRNKIILIVALVTLVAGFFVGKYFFQPKEEAKTEISHSAVVNKIEALGKLETVKLHIKDIVKIEKNSGWMLVPDDRLLLVINGEVTGCIDLAKIDSSSVIVESDRVKIKLPQPEICSFKVNHNESQVYDISSLTWSKSKLVDEGYKESENNLKKAAEKMDINTLTLNNAKIILKPLLEKLTNKPVEFI